MATRFVPRSCLDRPDLFDVRRKATFKPVESLYQAAVAAAAYAQHQVACDVNDRLGEDGDGALDELASRLGEQPDTLWRKLRGHSAAQLEDTYAWVLAFGQVEWVPAPSSIAELLPPANSRHPHPLQPG